MRVLTRILCALAALGANFSAAHAAGFQHIVVIVQENRTPDNLFYSLCLTPGLTCNSVNPNTSQYDIQIANWLDGDNPPSYVIQPFALPLGFMQDDITHDHNAFLIQCHINAYKTCRMDQAWKNCQLSSNCGTMNIPPQTIPYSYVDNSSHLLDPYITLATQYGWANYMFQTNQGESFPAHQFLFGATSAPDLGHDQIGTFADGNPSNSGVGNMGCTSDPGATVSLIDSNGNENGTTYPCFEHQTISDLFNTPPLNWRYYTTPADGLSLLWTAPIAIDHICQPNLTQPNQIVCQGPLYTQNVDTNSSDVLTDAASPKCALPAVSWVIPTGQNSDHAHANDGGGPSWVASIVNAIGQSQCTNPDGSSYWDSTAIIVTWDDWGGWYDHERPTFANPPYGGYTYGFRVPMIFVSAYTTAGLIDNTQLDFGAIARFIEGNFGFQEGALTFADARSNQDLHEFYNFAQQARPYVPIPTPKHASFFLHDKRKPLPPDDD